MNTETKLIKNRIEWQFERRVVSFATEISDKVASVKLYDRKVVLIADYMLYPDTSEKLCCFFSEIFF